MAIMEIIDNKDLPDKVFLYCNLCEMKSEYHFDSAILNTWLLNANGIVEAYNNLQTVFLYGIEISDSFEWKVFHFFLAHCDHELIIDDEQNT